MFLNFLTNPILLSHISLWECKAEKGPEEYISASNINVTASWSIYAQVLLKL